MLPHEQFDTRFDQGQDKLLRYQNEASLARLTRGKPLRARLASALRQLACWLDPKLATHALHQKRVADLRAHRAH